MKNRKKTVIQNLRSARNANPADSLPKYSATPGIRSPMMIMYETPTPKHLMAIAASKTTAAFGYVIWDSAKNEDDPLSMYLEHRDWRYSPKADVSPHQTIRMTPSVRPKWDIADGIASVPAPITVAIRQQARPHQKQKHVLVFTRLMLLLIMEALPPPTLEPRFRRDLPFQCQYHPHWSF